MSRLVIRVKMVTTRMLINIITRCEERSCGGASISMGNTISSKPGGSSGQPSKCSRNSWCYRRSLLILYTWVLFYYGCDGIGTKCTAPGVR